MSDRLPRRKFIRVCAAVSCGFSTTILPAATFAGSASTDAPEEGPNIFGPRAGFSPQIGVLVSMLTWMRAAILAPVQGLTIEQLDYLHDSKSNTIGALLLHLAATERHYQIHTFEGRKWNDWDDQTRRDWDAAAGLGEAARNTIKGHELPYYLAALNDRRAQTLAELRKRDDAWLMAIDHDWPWGPTNNYCKWFHVCEHESHHNGQVTWLKSRLPGVKESAG